MRFYEPVFAFMKTTGLVSFRSKVERGGVCLDTCMVVIEDVSLGFKFLRGVVGGRGRKRAGSGCVWVVWMCGCGCMCLGVYGFGDDGVGES